MIRSSFSVLAVLSIRATALAQTAPPWQATARSIFKELIEINTAHATGSTTVAAEARRTSRTTQPRWLRRCFA